jgi:hypothetical protein
MTKKSWLIIALLVTYFPIFASNERANKKEPSLQIDKTIHSEIFFTPIVALELWNSYSIGEEQKGVESTNRSDLSFRRVRFGGSGMPHPHLKYSFQLHLDRLGEDTYAATKGSYGGIDIWNAYITAKILSNSELINIHAGQYWAAISREFNTSPWGVSSLDKTRANWYMRNFITGKGNGIESGIGLGGLKNFEHFGVSYRIGTYEPQLYSSAQYASRLYTGRLSVSIGDAEESKYKYMLSGNQWNQRKGISIGLGGSTQSNGKLTDSTFFDQSYAYGGDLLLNYKGLRVDGEYFLFTRTGEGNANFDGTQWHTRLGYNFVVANQYIQPTITYDKYEGKGAKSLYKNIGVDKTLDIGINWFVKKDKLSLGLHYVIQDGSASPSKGDFLALSTLIRI